jgi:hypothetical protein
LAASAERSCRISAFAMSMIAIFVSSKNFVATNRIPVTKSALLEHVVLLRPVLHTTNVPTVFLKITDFTLRKTSYSIVAFASFVHCRHDVRHFASFVVSRFIPKSSVTNVNNNSVLATIMSNKNAKIYKRLEKICQCSRCGGKRVSYYTWRRHRKRQDTLTSGLCELTPRHDIALDIEESEGVMDDQEMFGVDMALGGSAEIDDLPDEMLDESEFR